MIEIQGKLDNKKWVPAIWVASIAVPIVVGILLNPRVAEMFAFAPETVEWARKLPYVNATFNSLVSICLILGLTMIKQGKRKAHQAFMMTAFGISALFLITYVTYHIVVGHVPYCESNLAPSWLYYTILITHIGLSVTIIPLASFSIFRALNETYDRHKKLARITFPLWLYVAVTGVAVVVMNSPCY